MGTDSMRDVVLVVDDEPFVLKLVGNVLANAGYTVLRAATPEEALRIGAEVKGPIALLLSDVIMPGLSGPSLAERFAELHPEALCMFMAGLPDTAEIQERILSRGRSLLPKPFFPAALLSKVRQVLGQQARVA